MASASGPEPVYRSPKKRHFLSKLFSRGKSEDAVIGFEASILSVKTNNEITTPSRPAISLPMTDRGEVIYSQSAPVQDNNNVTHEPQRRHIPPRNPPSFERWQTFTGPEVFQGTGGRQTRQSVRDINTVPSPVSAKGVAPATPKKLKGKRSTTGLASLFRAGRSPSASASTNPFSTTNGRPSISSPISQTAHAKGTSKTSSSNTDLLHAKNSHSSIPQTARKRASTVAVTGSSHPSSSGLNSTAHLFDASQAGMSQYHVDSGEDGYPIRYTPLYSPREGSSPSRVVDTTSSDASQSGSRSSSSSFFRMNGLKSNSTIDLTVLTSPSTSNPSAFTSPGVKGDENFQTRSQTPFGDLNSALSSHATSRSPSALSMRSPSRGNSLSLDRAGRSQSPTLNAYITSTLGRRNPPPNYLDHILDKNTTAQTGLGIMLSGTSEFGQVHNSDSANLDPRNANPPKHGHGGLSVKVAKELRPTTAGTFGRPRTANRPDTAVSRPDTGVSCMSDRPSTGLSAFGGSSELLSDFVNGLPAVPSLAAYQGRMRRRSNATDSENEEEVDITVDSTLAQAAITRNGERHGLPCPLEERSRKEDSGFAASAPGHSTGLQSMEGISLPNMTTSGVTDHHKASDASRIPVHKTVFRPDTADTTHLPFDLPDIDLAFHPKASLGSLGRQSSVSDLSEFGGKLEASTAALLSIRLSNHTMGDVQHSSSKVNTPNPRMSQAEETEDTPRKSVPSANSQYDSHIPLRGHATYLRKFMDHNNLDDPRSSSRNTVSSTAEGFPGSSSPPTPAIVTTSAPIQTAHARYRKSTGSLQAPSLPASYPVSVTRGSDLTFSGGRISQPDLVRKLSQSLDEATRNSDRLQQSLDSLRESTGADMRRATQQINDLKDENRLLREELKALLNRAFEHEPLRG